MHHLVELLITTTVNTPCNSLLILSVQTDLSSYNNKDIISISGVSDTTGTVNLSIENEKNEQVWTEQVSLKVKENILH